MAGGTSTFGERLCNLLGQGTPVFPSAEFIGQPRYTVGDVADDLCDLRNAIAHGNEIPSKFRKETGFEDARGKLIDGYSSAYQYRNVLEESALFLLCAALKTIFIRDLTDNVADEKRWRAYLKQRSP